MKSTREKKERRKYKDSKLYMQKARYVDEIDRKIAEKVELISHLLRKKGKSESYNLLSE